jgi:hypothetical protein
LVVTRDSSMPASAPARVLALLERGAFSPRVLRALFWLAALLAIATMVGRPPANDDAWFIDQAWFVASEGRLRSELFRGMLGWEDWLYITQKAGVLLTSVFVRVLGVVPLAAQLPGLLYAIVAALVLAAYVRRACPGNRTALLVSGAMLVANGAFVDFAFLVRPELMLGALALASCAVLEGVFVPRWRAGWRAALAGALAGASALFHLNGSMVMTAGGLFLLVRRRWLEAFVYSVAALAVASLYALDAVVRHEVPRMVHQFLLDPATVGSTSLPDKLATVAEVHRIFLHSPAQIAILVTIVFAAVACRRLRPAEAAATGAAGAASGLLAYIAALFVAFVVLLNRPANMYALLFCPLAMALFGVLHARLRSDARPGLRRAAAVVFAASMIAGLGHDVGLLIGNAEARDEVQFNQHVASLLPKKHVAVIAPLRFVFGQMENFRIMGLAKYAFPRDRETGLEWDLPRLADDAVRWGVEYIVFERRRGFFNFDPPDYPDRVGSYERFVAGPPLTIYRRAE